MGADFVEMTINYLKLLVIFLMMVQGVPILVWLERRGSAYIQNRFGPNRVGPLGLTQLLADAVKFLWKEEFLPKRGVALLYYGAPVMALIPGALAFAAIPLSVPIDVASFQMFGQSWGPYTFLFQGYEVGIGVIFIFAVSSLAAYSVLMAGYGSANKYSMLGALRASAQIISYELALSLSVVGILLVYQTVNLTEMIQAQQGPLSFIFMGQKYVFSFLPNWGFFYQPFGAILFFATTFAEANRLPFDLAESEAELVAGFHTEYGGFKMLLFFIGEYGHMMVASGLLATFYFGGYGLPVSSWTPEVVSSFIGSFVEGTTAVSLLTSLLFFFSFFVKFALCLWFFIWVRWTLPRFRYDQLMDLGWKTMLPWALVNTVLTAAVIVLSYGVDL